MNASALRDRAIRRIKAGRVDDAVADIELALSLEPTNHVIAHAWAVIDRHAWLAGRKGSGIYLNKMRIAFQLLSEGAWREGFAAIERVQPEAGCRDLDTPQWQLGLPIAGRTIRVYRAQRAFNGLGDSIMLVRYVYELIALGARVSLQASRSLQAIFQRIPGVEQVLTLDDIPTPTDYACALAGLPWAFGTTVQTVPCRPSYLAAARTIFTGRIGLCWKTNTAYEVKQHESRAPTRIVPLAEFIERLPRCLSYVSLQKNITPAEQVLLDARGIDHAEEELGFDEAASVIAGCAQVVTIDTSLAHLAGTLGVPTRMLLPFVADWRWLASWYPSMQVYRQHAAFDWSHALAQVGSELGSLIVR